MHKTPKRIFEEIARTRPPCERAWILRDHVCQGRSTMEHAWLYAGRQINDAWAIIRLCEWSHLGKGLDKEINHWISLQHATAADLAKYPRKDWEQLKKYLNVKYGKPEHTQANARAVPHERWKRQSGNPGGRAPRLQPQDLSGLW